MKKIIIFLILSFGHLCALSQITPQKHEFEITTADNFKLSAFSIVNKDKADHRPTVLLLHGGGRSKEIWESRGTVKDLFDAGYNIMAIDIRGNGKSDPQIQGQFTYPILDAKAAVKWIKENKQFMSGAIGAMGSSYGSNILVTGSVLSDLEFETMVLFSATAVTRRVIANPEMFRVKDSQNNKIKSAFYIASDNELERYDASNIAKEFFEITEKGSRKKLIVPGRYHGSSLYYSLKNEVLDWLKKRLPVRNKK